MNIIRFIEGFVLGSLIGAAAALLITPSSGEQLRGQIQSEVNRISGEVNKAASERRAELEKQLSELRSPRPSGPAAGPNIT
jgi:gas vesicle protein